MQSFRQFKKVLQSLVSLLARSAEKHTVGKEILNAIALLNVGRNEDLTVHIVH